MSRRSPPIRIKRQRTTPAALKSANRGANKKANKSANKSANSGANNSGANRPTTGEPKPGQPPTQSDLARRLGVSQNTVSAALRGSAKISDAVRAQVLAAAAELGYRPHYGAAAMVNGRLSSLALVMGTDGTRSALPGGMLDGIIDRAQAHDRHVLVAKLSDEALTHGGSLPRLLRELSADGMLINYSWRMPEELARLLQHHHIPAIHLNAARDTDCARPDDLAAGRQAARHLITAGHRRIAWVDLFRSAAGLRDAHYSQGDRERGFLAEAKQAGITASVWRPPVDAPMQDFLRHAQTLLRAEPQVTGVAVNHAACANAVVAEARALGRRIGDDLAMVLIDDQPGWGVGGGVPTFVIPSHAVGMAGVDLLLEKIDHPTRALPCRVLPFAFDPGHDQTPRS